MLNKDPPDPDVLAGYDGMDGVPECLVENAVFAKDEETLQKLVKSHVHERQGMVPMAQRFPTEEGQ